MAACGSGLAQRGALDLVAFNWPSPELSFGLPLGDALADPSVVPAGARVLLVSGPGTAESPTIQSEVERGLRDRLRGWFAGGVAYCGHEVIEAGVALGIERGVDCVVAVGGGGAIDSAKCITAGIGAGGVAGLMRAADNGQRESLRNTGGIRLVAVPATFAGAELNGACGLSATGGRSLSLSGLGYAPDVVVYDSAVALLTPRLILAGTAFNAFDHSLEVYLRAACRAPSSSWRSPPPACCGAH